MSSQFPTYIIITPARNEEKFIHYTIESVITQTILPERWVIVDDCSTDRTREIIENYQKEYSFIHLKVISESEKRNFGSKVYAINKGFEQVKDINYEFFCNLDADVAFEPTYFENLLKEFEKNPKLGLSGGKIHNLVDGNFEEMTYNAHSVAGAVQFFRRKCYESFGGYKPFDTGFIDGYAEISSRKNGWQTKTVTELKVFHYKPVGSRKGNKIKINYIGGQLEYKFGYYYPYHLLRSTILIFRKPVIIGGLMHLAGYLNCLMKNEARPVPDEFVSFVKAEQKERLVNKILSFFRMKRQIF